MARSGWTKEPARHSLAARRVRTSPRKSRSNDEEDAFKRNFAKAMARANEYEDGVDPVQRMLLRAVAARDADTVFDLAMAAATNLVMPKRTREVVDRGWLNSAACYQVSKADDQEKGETWEFAVLYFSDRGMLLQDKMLSGDLVGKDIIPGLLGELKALGRDFDGLGAALTVADLSEAELAPDEMNALIERAEELREIRDSFGQDGAPDFVKSMADMILPTAERVLRRSMQ